jgi:hypothetical protein
MGRRAAAAVRGIEASLVAEQERQGGLPGEFGMAAAMRVCSARAEYSAEMVASIRSICRDPPPGRHEVDACSGSVDASPQTEIG